jgi:hypothetical protein
VQGYAGCAAAELHSGVPTCGKGRGWQRPDAVGQGCPCTCTLERQRCGYAGKMWERHGGGSVTALRHEPVQLAAYLHNAEPGGSALLLLPGADPVYKHYYHLTTMCFVLGKYPSLFRSG